MRILVWPVLAVVAVATLACGTPPAPAPAATSPPVVTPAPVARVSFVNRVWRVAGVDGVATDQLYVFLSGGTLVITSATGTPMLGRWAHAGPGLTMVEEGREYTTDILSLTGDEFRLRSHNPGQPVEIRLVPADRDAAAATR